MIDFKNTEIAFSAKSNAELKKSHRLFKTMNASWLVNIGSKLGLWAVELGLPITPIIKATMFEQFCGGTTLLECQKTINHLAKFRVFTVLDYGAEAKETEEDFNHTMTETMRAIDFSRENPGKMPVVSCKITGMARFELLEKLDRGEELNSVEQKEYQAVEKRLDSLCFYAREKGIGIFIDAEESWIQSTIDMLTTRMMERYNKNNAVVFNTFQLYRTDRLQFLKDSYEQARINNYILGAKLVRGAYMEKERNRAKEMGYPSPIQPNKETTDRDYNSAVMFCIDKYESINSWTATHNEASTRLQIELMGKKRIANECPHLNFCQLYGMSDNLTYNLAAAGYNTAKYVVYGQVREVFPYLVRRAQENTSITGDMSRELAFIQAEMQRRGLL